MILRNIRIWQEEEFQAKDHPILDRVGVWPAPLFGAKGSARLTGIYELPEHLPVELEDLARKAKHLTTKKHHRTS